MKTFPLILVVLLVSVAGQAQPTVPPSLQPPPLPLQPLPPAALPARLPGAPPPAAAPAREHVNYLIRVEWQEPKGEPKSLEVLTTDGHFNLNTIQKTSVKINNNEIPTTLTFSGTLTPLDDEKGRLQLFLGRTVPYVTSTSGSGPNAMSSYQQLNVGLDSTFMVRFGKAAVVQNDESGQISVLVKRLEI